MTALSINHHFPDWHLWEPSGSSGETQSEVRRKELTAGWTEGMPPEIPPVHRLSLRLLKWMFVGEREIHTNLDLYNRGQWQKVNHLGKWRSVSQLLLGLSQSYPFRGYFVCVCMSVGGILLAHTLKLGVLQVSHFHISTYFPGLRDENIPCTVLDVKPICRWWYRWLLKELKQ